MATSSIGKPIILDDEAADRFIEALKKPNNQVGQTYHDMTVEDVPKDELDICPWCKTNEYLLIKYDIASLSTLDYWIECKNCDTVFYGRNIENCPATSVEEIIERWNKR